MKILFKSLVFVALFSFMSISIYAQSSKYKCLVQLNAYNGEKAYVTISLLDSKNVYQKTLYIMGKDKKWYNTIKEWFKFYNKSKKTDARTGASVAGGDRAIANLEIQDNLLNKGYKLRFETAVEDQKYYKDDVEIALTTEALSGKTDGKGYIKYIRFSKVQL